MFQSVLFFYFCICCLCRSYILSSKTKKVVTFYHQVLISMWATREAVGLLHFVMLVARLATFHDVLNLTPVICCGIIMMCVTVISMFQVVFPGGRSQFLVNV